MPKTIYNCDALTGGASRALDSYAVATLSDGNRAIVLDSSNNLTVFEFQSAATDAENVSTHPYRVRPDDYSSAGVWYEQEPAGAIVGDGIGGRILRAIRVYISDATEADKIKVETANLWNGDVIAAEDNLAKSGSTTSFSLDATGGQLTVKDSALSGTSVAVLTCNPSYNATAVAILAHPGVSGGLDFKFRDAATGAVVDLTGIIDGVNELQLAVIYITT